jgi:ankyrin repeat protein
MRLRYGALDDINAVDQRGITPLHNACFSSNVEITQYLVERGASIQAKDTKVMIL